MGGEGNWDTVKKPGKNGIRIVLISLAWWGLMVADTRHDSYSPAAHEDWCAAAKDVVWVVYELAALAAKLKKRSREDVEGSSAPEKRCRC
ncbi:hypothetical protein V8D89_012142 [Ganoderma adspersum]